MIYTSLTQNNMAFSRIPGSYSCLGPFHRSSNESIAYATPIRSFQKFILLGKSVSRKHYEQEQLTMEKLICE